jgi:hypothetical protein
MLPSTSLLEFPEMSGKIASPLPTMPKGENLGEG